MSEPNCPNDDHEWDSCRRAHRSGAMMLSWQPKPDTRLAIRPARSPFQRAAAPDSRRGTRRVSRLPRIRRRPGRSRGLHRLRPRAMTNRVPLRRSTRHDGASIAWRSPFRSVTSKAGRGRVSTTRSSATPASPPASDGPPAPARFAAAEHPTPQRPARTGRARVDQ